MVWQLLHSPLASCGAVWQYEQLLGAMLPLWHWKHDDIFAGSTYSGGLTVVWTKRTWQQMQSISECLSWEKVTVGRVGSGGGSSWQREATLIGDLPGHGERGVWMADDVHVDLAERA